MRAVYSKRSQQQRHTLPDLAAFGMEDMGTLSIHDTVMTSPEEHAFPVVAQATPVVVALGRRRMSWHALKRTDSSTHEKSLKSLINAAGMGNMIGFSSNLPTSNEAQLDQIIPNFVSKQVRQVCYQMCAEVALKSDSGSQEPLAIPPLVPSATEAFAAVVMVDVSGYSKLTAVLAERGPIGAELLTRTMKGYLDKILQWTHETIIQTIVAHGGDIVKFAGDAVIFCWKSGKAINLTDSSQDKIRGELVYKASHCCLTLLTKLGTYDIEVEDCPTKILRIHLGIGAGLVYDVLVGGEPGRWEHFIAGDGVNQLSQVLDLAKAGELALSHQALKWLACVIDIATVNLGDYDKRCIILTGLEKAVRKGHASPDVEDEIVFKSARQMEANVDLYKLFVDRTALFKLQADINQSRLFQMDAGLLDLLNLTELRQVTTIFIKVGSLQVVHRNDILDESQRAISIVQTALHRCEGSLRQFHVDDKGAVILCFFGLPPLAHENDAGLGIKAGIEIRDRFFDIFDDFSIGITTGVVSYGGVGSSGRAEYAVMGDSINMAARLMCHAEAAEEFFAMKRQVIGREKERKCIMDALCRMKTAVVADAIIIKADGGQAGCHVGAIFGSSFPNAAGADALTSQFIGKSLSSVKEGVDNTSPFKSQKPNSPPQCTQSVSPPTAHIAPKPRRMSIIKTVDSDEFLSERTFPTARGKLTSSHPSGSDAMVEASEEENYIPKIAQALFKLHEASEDAGLFELIFPAKIDGELNIEVQAALQLRIHDLCALLSRVLRTLSEHNKLIFVLNEAQWMDPMSWEFLMEVLVSCPRVAVFIFTRPEGSFESRESKACLRRIEALPRTTTLTVGGLNIEETRRLIIHTWTGPTITKVASKIVESIYKRTDGNPFFIRSLTLAMKESGQWRVSNEGVLSTQNGNFDFEKLVLGYDNQSILVAQFDRLDRNFQLLLKVAAVLGQRFLLDDVLYFLTGMAGVHERIERKNYNQIIRGVQTTDKYGFLQRDATTSEGAQFQFKSAVVRKCIYSMMVHKQRQQLHKHVGTYYETRLNDANRHRPSRGMDFKNATIANWHRELGHSLYMREEYIEAEKHLLIGLKLYGAAFPETKLGVYWSTRRQLQIRLRMDAAFFENFGTSSETPIDYLQSYRPHKSNSSHSLNNIVVSTSRRKDVSSTEKRGSTIIQLPPPVGAPLVGFNANFSITMSSPISSATPPVNNNNNNSGSNGNNISLAAAAPLDSLGVYEYGRSSQVNLGPNSRRSTQIVGGNYPPASPYISGALGTSSHGGSGSVIHDYESMPTSQVRMSQNMASGSSSKYGIKDRNTSQNLMREPGSARQGPAHGIQHSLLVLADLYWIRNQFQRHQVCVLLGLNMVHEATQDQTLARLFSLGSLTLWMAQIHPHRALSYLDAAQRLDSRTNIHTSIHISTHQCELMFLMGRWQIALKASDALNYLGTIASDTLTRVQAMRLRLHIQMMAASRQTALATAREMYTFSSTRECFLDAFLPTNGSTIVLAEEIAYLGLRSQIQLTVCTATQVRNLALFSDALGKLTTYEWKSFQGMVSVAFGLFAAYESKALNDSSSRKVAELVCVRVNKLLKPMKGLSFSDPLRMIFKGFRMLQANRRLKALATWTRGLNPKSEVLLIQAFLHKLIAYYSQGELAYMDNVVQGRDWWIYSKLRIYSI
ncbi:hypothetical protein BSLG_009028 [Batrachochytrium salamandrivorans]|nr:hypothetical protein BSLG_009028 [Batrachochytrium salamandrivorans]